MADNETPVFDTIDTPEETAPESNAIDYTGFEPEPEPESDVDPEGLWPTYHTLELAELRAIRELLTIQVQQFATVVQIAGELGAKADGLFSGDGAMPSGPMGMILGALVPKRGR